MAQRIKGQDVTLVMLQGGTPLGYMTSDIRNFEVTPKIEKLEEQYLGQYSKKYDEIFHGVDFKFDIHVESANSLKFMEFLRNRGQGAAGVQVSITAVLKFPNNVQSKLTLNNCFFEDVPFSFGGRSEYGQMTISGSCETFSVH